MGTPHRGSDLASWGTMFAGIAKAAGLHPTKNIKDLQNNSSTLKDVSEDFRSIVEKYSIVSFYEDTKIKGLNKEVDQRPTRSTNHHCHPLILKSIGCWEAFCRNGNIWIWGRSDTAGREPHGDMQILWGE